MNELLFICTLIVCMGGIFLSYRFFGEYGIYGWVAFCTIFANMEVLEGVHMFGMESTLGNAMFGTMYLATDILSEMHGKKASRRAVMIGFFCEFIFIIMAQIDLHFIPSVTDTSHGAFEVIFSTVPRICVGSMVSYAIGNMIDIKLYEMFKDKDGDKRMWLRNNLCTIVCQLLDNFILYFIAFGGQMSIGLITEICVSSWLIEIVVALCDTPILYMSKMYAKKNMEKMPVAA